MSARLLASIATLSVLAISSGCDSHCLPLVVGVDTTFAPAKRAVINEMAEQWNQKAGPRYRYGSIVLRLRDVEVLRPNGNLLDQNDRCMMVSSTTQEITGWLGVGASSIHIHTHAYVSSDSENFRADVLRQFGHLLGLSNMREYDGVLNSNGINGMPVPRDKLTEADINAFCRLYDCR